jgi:hypothetical protein
LLDGDVGFRLELQVALFRLGAVVVVERPLDVDGVGVVPFDQVAVVAVHRPHQIGERAHDAFGQAAPEPGRPGRKLDRKVYQAGAVARPLQYEQRLHQTDGFAPVFAIRGRFCGRFDVRFRIIHRGSIPRR